MNGEPMPGSAVDSVDAIQVFKTDKPQEGFRRVADVRSRKWIYETSDPIEIHKFLLAFRQRVSPNGCISVDAKSAYVVLLFDHELMRVALIKYYPCDGRDFGALDPTGSSGLRFSSAVAPLIERDRYWPPD